MDPGRRRSAKPSSPGSDPTQRRIYGLPHVSRCILPQDRPRCLWCDQALALKLEWVSRPSKATAWLPVKPDERAIAWAKLEDGVLKVWCGEYHGQCVDSFGTPLFCSPDCTQQFSQDAYRHGFRAKLRGRTLTREQPRGT